MSTTKRKQAQEVLGDPHHFGERGYDCSWVCLRYNLEGNCTGCKSHGEQLEKIAEDVRPYQE